MSKITIQEARAMWGNVEMKFSSYYKFVFHFVGYDATTNTDIEVALGGSSDGIYKFELSEGQTFTFKDLVQHDITWINVRLRDTDKEVFRWSEWS